MLELKKNFSGIIITNSSLEVYVFDKEYKGNLNFI